MSPAAMRLGGEAAAAAATRAGANVGGAAAPRMQAAIMSDRGVGAWLLGVSGAVFGMVVLGGVTRLTRSGLSMVDWRPQGSMLPQTDEAWAAEFEKYKQFPEYKRLNQGMSLDEFKHIYFMEWFHRMWGRGLGFVFGVPFLYFMARGRIQRLPGMTPKLFGLLALGGGQGLVGWWMVKSGLEEPTNEWKEPRVSPYRLAAHLTVALGVFTGLVWTGLTALNPQPLLSTAVDPRVLRLRSWGAAVLGLVGITFVSGAFVAGNDAGRAYNDWPFYAGEWIPREFWDSRLEPAWRNIFENTATVQFDHRNLAYTTLFSTLALFHIARRSPNWKVLSPAMRTGYNAMVVVVCCQVLLGISTLMMFVPVELGAAHQAGALTLWTTMLYSQHALRFLRR
ncbi:Cytochrome c oxidase assembly protein COX15 [Hondaea fermentalgiana]|uniref:Cytochrome c oxidase assembly protein COX15 n=1 Tax=Hondaea fermentalgiana TaxID=2315210 RepID=A0A2R5GTH0_9STRA|nr:Cytochrome c oxidase assembly protein COX15 [Hondaea fermentalgiana]|eukprot:GBG34166.1 Cytochrome c oxidase assembly protein COX15 [Hondaea fermentalgiana]